MQNGTEADTSFSLCALSVHMCEMSAALCTAWNVHPAVTLCKCDICMYLNCVVHRGRKLECLYLGSRQHSLWCHLLADVCHLCTPAQPYTCHMIVKSIGLAMCFMWVTQVCMRNPSEGSSSRMMQPKPHHSLLQRLPDFVILSSEWRERYPNLY